MRLIHTIYQQAVVGRSVTVEKVNKGLYVLHREGQVVAVALSKSCQPRRCNRLSPRAGQIWPEVVSFCLQNYEILLTSANNLADKN